MNLEQEIVNIAKTAKEASRQLSIIPVKARNKALRLMSDAVIKNSNSIARANAKDVDNAKKRGLSMALIDRLYLDEKRIGQMSESLLEVSRLPEVVGEEIDSWKRPNGLKIAKVRVPIGVIAIIYESRPNVTSDCIGLCLKSGNAVILRGGSESLCSNLAIFDALNRSSRKAGIPHGAISILNTSVRKAVDILLKQNEYIDLVIPRGGEGLIRMVNEKSRISVIKHYKGVCHTYVDSEADLKLAQRVSFNAKVQRPSVCNAMETLLVHKNVAKKFLPVMIKSLIGAGVRIKGCANTRKIISGIEEATEKDWSTEYLDLILSVKIVNSLVDAIKHINKYGTRHSDAIITRSLSNANEFMRRVDSACVYSNASTRFTDGGEFGLGCEIGISTDKLHARGPMGLKELTTYKYLITGSGQIRQ